VGGEKGKKGQKKPEKEGGGFHKRKDHNKKRGCVGCLGKKTTREKIQKKTVGNVGGGKQKKEEWLWDGNVSMKGLGWEVWGGDKNKKKVTQRSLGEAEGKQQEL